MKKYWLIPLLVVIVSLIGLSVGCVERSESSTDKPQKKAKKIPLVETSFARITELSQTLELTGSIEPTRVARMASSVEGPMIACLVREGHRVRAGQLLAELGNAKGDDAVVLSAQAVLKRENIELGRIDNLVKSGALPGEEFEKALVKVSTAKAKLAQATEKLDDYQIIAPWDGAVFKVHVAEGDFVLARSTLIEIFDPQSLVLRFAVPENRAVSVKVGTAMRVTLDAHPGKILNGKVTLVYPEIDRNTHTCTVEGVLNEDTVLVPGMFARLLITLASAPKAIAIPRLAVLSKKGTKTAFVIKANGLVEKRLLKTGIEDGKMVQITDGIHPGERVAVAGHARLRDGMKVRLRGDDSQAGKLSSSGMNP